MLVGRTLTVLALPVCVFALILYILRQYGPVAHIGAWLERWPGRHHRVRSHGSDLYYAGKYKRGRHGVRVFLPYYAPWSIPSRAPHRRAPC
jgi:hypothetical protein